jgi:hypothetical protein
MADERAYAPVDLFTVVGPQVAVVGARKSAVDGRLERRNRRTHSRKAVIFTDRPGAESHHDAAGILYGVPVAPREHEEVYTVRDRTDSSAKLNLG